MWYIAYLFIFLISFLLSLVCVRLALYYAVRFKVLDQPDNARKIHVKSTPLLGGAGIFLSFFLAIGIGIILYFSAIRAGFLGRDFIIHSQGLKTALPQLAMIFLAALAIFIMGVIDDFKKLSARLKLSIEILVALLMFYSGIRVSLFIQNPLVNAVLTVCWIIGITNAFNLLDNMDGLSCGVALISSLIFFIIAASSGQLFVASILACFCGVLLGFLKYNFPPAKIFMGDGGSLFIGFILSLLTIVNTYYTNKNPTPWPVIMPLVIMAVPIFDTFSVIYVRLKKKVSIFKADKNHLSHRLVKMGMSNTSSILFIYLLNFAIGLGALLLLNLDGAGCLIVLLETVCILLLIALLEKANKCYD
ncbi:MAG: undecaprenyl/decaprenyl-phosphate alpha-N-acetylglucosaminyl 1-phosphate transferase [Candidatus Omnitrophica bacterium]|nr:undecaprenyl/decaprenyl-phosphate alpha-N-acetylglucosaminyl 1-phosphate transferase [Candidatus Omnitrophota bacterium]MBU1925092.1 undecaprenyl/decaprenyl-phosphate alpha-N-acetylglucosaminyl 1-phosphate transferase [Candidatus Omnitrophota bacterium]